MTSMPPVTATTRASSRANGAVALAALVLLTAGCSGGTGAPEAAELPAGIWTLTAGEVDGAPLTLDPAFPPTLERTDDGAAGSGGCNRWFGELTGDLAAPRFGQLGSTEMWCEGQMDTEQAYLTALPRVETGALADGVLTLTGDGVSLVFAQG